MSDHSDMVGANYIPKCHAVRVHVLSNSCVQVTSVSCVCVHESLYSLGVLTLTTFIFLVLYQLTFANMIQVVSREHLPLTY